MLRDFLEKMSRFEQSEFLNRNRIQTEDKKIVVEISDIWQHDDDDTIGMFILIYYVSNTWYKFNGSYISETEFNNKGFEITVPNSVPSYMERELKNAVSKNEAYIVDQLRQRIEYFKSLTDKDVEIAKEQIYKLI